MRWLWLMFRKRLWTSEQTKTSRKRSGPWGATTQGAKGYGYTATLDEAKAAFRPQIAWCRVEKRHDVRVRRYDDGDLDPVWRCYTSLSGGFGEVA